MNRVKELSNIEMWIIDIIPQRVPENSKGQYFRIEQFYLDKKRIENIRQKQANVILKLNCYMDIYVDGMGDNPDPEVIAKSFQKQGLNIQIGNALLVTDPDDTNMTLYKADYQLLELTKAIALAEGLFVWKP
jgi:hypothetical protein